MKFTSSNTKSSRNLSFLSPTLPIILYHHKRFDNKGYPVEDTETEIPLAAKILALADAFDAMTSERPYRGKLSLAKAQEELEKGSGTQFDPEVVRVFRRISKSIKEE